MPPSYGGDAHDLYVEVTGQAELWANELAMLADAESAQELKRAHGSPPERAFATRLIAQHFSWLLAAISDVADSGLPTAARPEREDKERGWRSGRVIHPAYDAYVGWCAAPSLDVAAARSAVAAIREGELRAQLTTDLDALARVAEGKYSRIVTTEQIGDVTLWITAGAWDDWTLNEPLRRLGREGVLRAAGAIAWSAAPASSSDAEL